MKKLSRREMVLEIYDREAMGEVSAKEIALINSRLVDEYGDGGAMTPAQIARILVDEDLPVKLDEVFRMSGPNDAYESAFEGMAVNHTLDGAEKSLTRIDRLFRMFAERQDRTGVRYARQTALRARQNAAELASADSLSRSERMVQKEIEEWFRIWLHSPDIFSVWLDTRKSTAEFKEKFGPNQTTS